MPLKSIRSNGLYSNGGSLHHSKPLHTPHVHNFFYLYPPMIRDTVSFLIPSRFRWNPCRLLCEDRCRFWRRERERSCKQTFRSRPVHYISAKCPVIVVQCHSVRLPCRLSLSASALKMEFNLPSRTIVFIWSILVQPSWLPISSSSGSWPLNKRQESLPIDPLCSVCAVIDAVESAAAATGLDFNLESPPPDVLRQRGMCSL